MAKSLGVSEDVAHAVLLKNSWDEAAATEAFHEEPDYVLKTFQLPENYGVDNGEIGEPFTCPCCDEDYEGEDAVQMPECGHRMCNECFTMNA